MENTSSPHFVDSAMQQVLELSAEAQIKRRSAAKDSAAYHELTGAIHAFGAALGVLSRLQQVEESRAASSLLIIPREWSECPAAVS